MALADNLISYLKMDESSGTRVDAHGSNDLTAGGTGGVGSATGIINDAADFELADADVLYITDASQSGLDVTGDFSISAWINIESAPGSGVEFDIVSKHDNGAANQRSFIASYENVSGNGFRFRVSSSGTSGTQSTAKWLQTLTTATWYHVVFAYSAAGNVSLYVNGSLVSNVTGQRTSVFNGTAPFTVGARGNGGSTFAAHFDGLIDEVGIWGRTLDATDVSDLYNAGAGLSYEDITGGGGGAPTPTLMMLGVGT